MANYARSGKGYGGVGTQPYGPIGGNLRTVTTPSGKRVSVDAAVANRMSGFLSDLENAGYNIDSLGGYNDRNKVGKAKGKSQHAYGNAIDINPGVNAQGSYVNDLPSNISEMAGKYGLEWGGNWSPAYADPMHFEGKQFAPADLASLPSVAAGLYGSKSADQIDRLQERADQINGVQPATPAERMWSAVSNVVGAPVTAAMRAGNISVGIGLSLADQAAKIAQNSAQQQNAPQDSPANRMRSAVGLPAHPSTPTPDNTPIGAPVGQVERGPDLAAPAARMHEAISQQYGGPMAAADAAKAQGISYSPNFDQTFADAASTMTTPNAPLGQGVGLGSPPSPTVSDAGPIAAATRSQEAPKPNYPSAPKESVPNWDAASAASVPKPAGVSLQEMAAPAVTTPIGFEASAAPDIGNFSLANTVPASPAPAPAAPPVAAPKPAPKPITRPVMAAPKPRTIQSVQPTLPQPTLPAGLETAVTKARPGTSLFDAISQNNLAAAPQGTRWGVGVTGKPVAVPTSAPEGVQIAASGTGLLGALGLTSPQQAAPQQQSSGFFANLGNTLSNLFGGSNGGGYSTASGYGRQVQANADNLASLVASNPYLSGGGGGISMGGGYRTSNEGGNLHG